MKTGQKKGERWGVTLACACGNLFYRAACLATIAKYCSKKCKHKFQRKSERHNYLQKRYQSQKYTSSRRQIKFLLSFEQWVKIWEDSGRLDARGRVRGAYCMARLGDKGPYAVGNIKIITFDANCAERIFSESTRNKMRRAQIGRKHTTVTKAKIRAASLKQRHSAETRAKLRALRVGKKTSARVRAKISSGLRLAWRERRR